MIDDGDTIERRYVRPPPATVQTGGVPRFTRESLTR